LIKQRETERFMHECTFNSTLYLFKSIFMSAK